MGVTPGQDLKSVCKQSDKCFLFLFSPGLSSPLTTRAAVFLLSKSHLCGQVGGGAAQRALLTVQFGAGCKEKAGVNAVI